jgi:hypothetical protein
MPDVRDQGMAASPSKLGLYSLDEIPADASASRPLRDDQFATLVLGLASNPRAVVST